MLAASAALRLVRSMAEDQVWPPSVESTRLMVFCPFATKRVIVTYRFPWNGLPETLSTAIQSLSRELALPARLAVALIGPFQVAPPSSEADTAIARKPRTF